jgi:hypothetical protein
VTAEKNTVKREGKKKKICKKKMKDYYEKQLKWLQECDAKYDSRKFYMQENRMRDGF